MPSLPKCTEMDSQMSFNCFFEILHIRLVKFKLDFTNNSPFINFPSDFRLSDLQYKFG